LVAERSRKTAWPAAAQGGRRHAVARRRISGGVFLLSLPVLVLAGSSRGLGKEQVTGETNMRSSVALASRRRSSALALRHRHALLVRVLAICLRGERECIFASPLSFAGKMHRPMPSLLEGSRACTVAI
jgi:hypothetical protein